MNFSFATAGRIIFGEGELRNLPAHIKALDPALGKRETPCLLVTGSQQERARGLLELLDEADFVAQVVQVSSEPTLEDVHEAVAAGRSIHARFVIGFGGGSAIDLAKASSALLANEGDIMEYLEVIGRGNPLSVPALPCVAIPTTSGTGAEVTKNAVLGSPEHRVKVSLRHDSMLPRLALVDPELTYSVPPDVTAATGLDALTQCIEPYLSCMAQPLTDAIALQGIELGARSLLLAVQDGNDRKARHDMSLCSLFGGLALANAKLGAIHGFAGPFGGMFKSPHGAVCARLLAPVLRANLAALRERAPESPVLPRFSVLARIVTGDPRATAEDGIFTLEALTEKLNVKGLGSYGLSARRMDELIEKSTRSSSMKGNPLPLAREELAHILTEAL